MNHTEMYSEYFSLFFASHSLVGKDHSNKSGSWKSTCSMADNALASVRKPFELRLSIFKFEIGIGINDGKWISNYQMCLSGTSSKEHDSKNKEKYIEYISVCLIFGIRRADGGTSFRKLGKSYE